MIKTVETIESSGGRVIECLECEGTKNDSVVLIIGVFHGDEPQGEYLINRFLKQNKSGKNRILYIPCLNPDGKVLGTRQNSAGIDLNRNFPTRNRKVLKEEQYFGGSIPASEVETRFVINILEKYKPDMILTLHSPYRVVNYDGPAEKVAIDISKITGYPVEADIGYETPGSFGTYAGKERNIKVITLELPEDKTDEDLYEEVSGVFEYCLDDFATA